MILLVKVPRTVPFVVLEFDVVGYGEVLQQTPRAVIDDSSSEATFAEKVAVVVEMLVS